MSATAPVWGTAAQPDLTGVSGWVVGVVDALGAGGVGLLVAAENVFPPIPSEVVLAAAGYAASRGQLGVVVAVIAATAGSYVGALVLYALGAALGRSRVRQWVARVPLVELEDLDRAERWFGRHGGRAVLIGRCVPVVRSVISVPAGVEQMPLARFSVYTIAGSAVWNALFIGAGYLLAARWQDVGRYSDVLNVVVLAVLGLTVASFVSARLRRHARRR